MLPADLERRRRQTARDAINQAEVTALLQQQQQKPAAAAAVETPAAAKARREAEKALLERQLRKSFPNALQCPRCSLGPVDMRGCTLLDYHQGEAAAGGGVVDNRCKRCGFFGQRVSEWKAWNGRLPDDDDAPPAARPAATTRRPVEATPAVPTNVARITSLGFDRAEAEAGLRIAHDDVTVCSDVLFSCRDRRVSILSPDGQLFAEGLARTLVRRQQVR